MYDQRFNVISSFPKSRDMDMQGIQPVQQVESEKFILDTFF
jgi:hypothetical protein